MTTQTQTRRHMREAILIRGTNWIGDTVMSLAAIRELRRLYPDRRLVLAARPWVGGLFEQQGLVDSMVSIPKSAGPWEEARLLRRTGEHFTQGVILPNSFASALAGFLAGIPRRFGYRRDARHWLLSRSARPRIKDLRRHQVYYYLDLLFQTGLSPLDYLQASDFQPNVRLTATTTGRLKADTLLRSVGVKERRPRVALNPGAYYGPAKRWLPERYARVADALVESVQAEILLVGTAGERRLAGAIQDQMRHSPRLLTGKTDLPTLLGVLASCRLLITNDSGPMHLAAALDIPQLALFGSTDAVATGPLSPQARIIHKHVACSPCLLRECPLDLRCFDRITVDEVTGTALEMLASGEDGR